MAEVAKANERAVRRSVSRRRASCTRKPRKPLTINGIHLNERRQPAAGRRSSTSALFAGEPAPSATPPRSRSSARPSLDKNFHWFNRYRTVDGYSIYGGRADLKFVDGQTNREVMQREMEVLDVMTANRDKRIWAVAQGERPARSTTATRPPFIPVDDQQARARARTASTSSSTARRPSSKMTVAKGMKVNLFASEKEFPELAKPVQMAFDTKGRLWVAVWPTYPHWKPKEAMNDKLLILEDTDGDGKADKCTVFADNLHCPTGFEFCNGGVLVAQAPDLLFLKDTDGDDKADVRERVLHGLDSADTHHTANSFVLDPGGALYFQEGTFHHTQVETPYGPPVRLRQRRRLPLRAADAEVRRLRHATASPTRTATSSTAGARTSSSTAPARNPYHAAAVLRPPRLSRTSTAGRRRSTSSGRGPAPASRSSPAGTSPTRCRATCWSPT